MILPLGSIVNALSVIIGSIIGIYFGSFLSEKIRKAIFQIIGLFTLALGMQMSLKTNQFLILLVSLIIGTIIGESLSIEKGIESLSNKLKIKLQSENKLFSEGLITAFLLYFIGLIVIFPANRYHSVIYDGTKDRMIIGVNFYSI